MQEYHGVACVEEILGGCGAPGAGREVVDEADGLRFEGDDGAAGCDEDYWAIGGVMMRYESSSEGGVGLEGFRGCFGGEVVGVRGRHGGW